MNPPKIKKIWYTFFPALAVVTTTVFFPALPAAGHGPKGHGNMAFTPLQAAKQGIELYDKLVARGKLAESWETGLVDIKVYSRQKNAKKETIVRFDRTEGNPRSVFIFFDEKGKYSGSNFTGE